MRPTYCNGLLARRRLQPEWRNYLGSVGKYRAVREVIVDGNDSWNVFCHHADRFSFLVGSSITPEVDNSVRNRHVQIMRVRPGMLLQFAKQPLSNRGIGKGQFELRSRARNNLDQVRATDDADEIAVLVDDRKAPDLVLLEQCRDFVQWRFRDSCYDV